MSSFRSYPAECDRSRLKKQPGQCQTLSAMLSLALTIGLFSAACRAPTQPASPDRVVDSAQSIETGSQPVTVLTLVAIPWQNSAEQQSKLQELAAYLREKSGIAIQVEMTASYEEAVDLLTEEKVQLAYLGAFTYIKARDRNPQLEPLVVPIEKTTGRPWYTSVIVVRADSGIQTLEDLKGKRFSFVSASSTSGFLLPSVQFQELGIDPEQDFSTVEYSGGHNKSAEILAAGKVDAIATESQAYSRESQFGVLAAENYKVIWESDPIPNGPLVVSSQLPNALKLALSKALLNAPDGLADISGAESSGYSIAADSDYDSIRRLQAALKP